MSPPPPPPNSVLQGHQISEVGLVCWMLVSAQGDQRQETQSAGSGSNQFGWPTSPHMMPRVLVFKAQDAM